MIMRKAESSSVEVRNKRPECGHKVEIMIMQMSI